MILGVVTYVLVVACRIVICDTYNNAEEGGGREQWRTTTPAAGADSRAILGEQPLAVADARDSEHRESLACAPRQRVAAATGAGFQGRGKERQTESTVEWRHVVLYRLHRRHLATCAPAI